MALAQCTKQTLKNACQEPRTSTCSFYKPVVLTCPLKERRKGKLGVGIWAYCVPGRWDCTKHHGILCAYGTRELRHLVCMGLFHVADNLLRAHSMELRLNITSILAPKVVLLDHVITSM